MTNAVNLQISNSTESIGPADVKLLELIVSNGVLDGILARTSSSADLGLHRRICQDVQTLKRAYENPEYFSCLGGAPADKDSVYGPSATWMLSVPDIDPVLGYSIACAVGLDEVANRLFDEAWRRYHRASTAYGSVLDGFIPTGFLAWAAKTFAHEAYSKGTNATAAQDWPVHREIQEREAGVPSWFRLRTGLSKLDTAIGGLDGLMIIAGDKGVGKTTLIIQLIVGALRHDPDLAVLLYSLDLAKNRIYDRLLCHEAYMDYRTLMSPGKSEEAKSRLQQAHESLARDIPPRMRVLERTFPPQNDGFWFNSLCNDGNGLLSASGKNKLLVVVDLFQRMEVPVSVPDTSDNSDSESRVRIGTEAERDDFRLDAIKRFRDAFRRARQPNGPPVIIASEIRKGDDPRRELTRDDLKGSSRISSDADTVIMMHGSRESSADAATVPVTLRIDKGRDGVIRGDIPTVFRHTVYRFEEGQPSQKESKNRAASLPALDTFDAAS